MTPDLPPDQFDFDLRRYGFMLAVALLGGVASWVAKVRRGEAAPWNVMHLIGELATSAFAGLLCFWICQASGMSLSWTVPLVAISGHMGIRAIAVFEQWAERKWGQISGEKE